MFVEKVVPYFHVCMTKLQLGADVVMDGFLKEILYAKCSYLNILPAENSDGSVILFHNGVALGKYGFTTLRKSNYKKA
ncbi:hypothetical protein [Bacillus tuaregi]|uniref:hypothetical protein n=1 Tax=Bacillus tuaregi TaxID=1816695 RepID=UPI0008F83249|nr:hypothetical protein [Bacillus tuaregi]